MVIEIIAHAHCWRAFRAVSLNINVLSCGVLSYTNYSLAGGYQRFREMYYRYPLQYYYCNEMKLTHPFLSPYMEVVQDLAGDVSMFHHYTGHMNV
jgi:hypothetical protein